MAATIVCNASVREVQLEAAKLAGASRSMWAVLRGMNEDLDTTLTSLVPWNEKV